MKLRFSEKVIAFIINCDLGKLRKLTVQSLAEEFEYNWSYFSSKFKKETQMLVSEYIKKAFLFMKFQEELDLISLSISENYSRKNMVLPLEISIK